MLSLEVVLIFRQNNLAGGHKNTFRMTLSTNEPRNNTLTALLPITRHKETFKCVDLEDDVYICMSQQMNAGKKSMPFLK